MKLTTAEAAEELGVSDGTIRQKCQAGILKCERVWSKYHPEGSWLVGEGELSAYVKKRELPKCKPLSDADQGYIAGFCDGEGCFTCFINNVRNRQEWWNTSYFIQILVVEEEPIRWLKEVTGVGYVFQRKRQEHNYQNLWGWRVTNHVACAVIRQIMPYLKIKHRHAEIFLELEQRIIQARNYRIGKNVCGMPKEEYFERQKLIDEIHRLNKPTGKVLRKEYSLAEAT